MLRLGQVLRTRQFKLVSGGVLAQGRSPLSRLLEMSVCIRLVGLNLSHARWGGAFAWQNAAWMARLTGPLAPVMASYNGMARTRYKTREARTVSKKWNPLLKGLVDSF